MPSAPWRFSTTTGWPQRSLSRSATRRPARSVPLPGGSGMMNRTVFSGQVWKGGWENACARAAPVASASASSGPAAVAVAHRTTRHRAFMLSNSLKSDGDAPDRIDLEGDGVLVGFDRQRWHHRAGDDDLASAQALAEGREHIRHVPYDADPFAGIGLRIRRARGLGAAPNDAARQPSRVSAGARRPRATEHHMTLVDVVAQDAFGFLGRRRKIDDLDRR